MADLEHVKLIQAVISRMAANSFVLKGWAVTLVTGLAALARVDGNDDIAWISLGVLLVFAPRRLLPVPRARLSRA